MSDRRANKRPKHGHDWDSDKVHDRRDFLRHYQPFFSYHSGIQPTYLTAFNLRTHVTHPVPARSGEWKLLQMQRAIKITEDTVFHDKTGLQCLLYIHKSIRPKVHQEMSSKARELIGLLHARSYSTAQASDSRYTNFKVSIGRYVDFTSVGQGQGHKGILMSKHGLASAEAMDPWSRLLYTLKPAVQATAFMYHYLATQGTGDLHQSVLDTAKSTYDKSNPVVKSLLMGPWNPFSQTRLIYNLISEPHVDATNDRATLNALTFFGGATAWLIVMIEGQSYAFDASPGNSILFPAAMLEHFVWDGQGEERLVLTSWTSSSLQYRSFLMPARS